MSNHEQEHEYICDHCGDGCDDVGPVQIGSGNEQDWCPDCTDDAIQCDGCGVMTDDDYDRIGNDYRCATCASEQVPCDHCGDYCHIHDLDDGWCPYCTETECRDSDEPIKDYGFKPEPMFHRTSDDHRGGGALSFGLENEQELDCGWAHREKAASELTDQMGGFIYCKDDCSINNGFEIVSHPFTRNWWYANQHKLGNALDRLAGLYDAKTDEMNTCGMHVHISKDQLTSQELKRLCHLIYEHESFTLHISNRDRDSLREWASCGEPRERWESKCEQKLGGGRNAVNMNNSATVELRIFKGTSDSAMMRRNMETVFALVDFIRQDIYVSDCTPESFAAFVHANRSEYPLLASHMRVSAFHNEGPTVADRQTYERGMLLDRIWTLSTAACVA